MESLKERNDSFLVIESPRKFNKIKKNLLASFFILLLLLNVILFF